MWPPGWTEPRALNNKARPWVTDAIDDVCQVLPFRLLGLDSDNGAEFINHHLLAYSETNRITFIRGRPFRKNDSCYVEQKNWAIVRQAVGYARYETDAELAIRRALRASEAVHQLFLPAGQALAKAPDGAKMSRRHDTPATPYQRLLDSGMLTKAQAAKLTALYRSLNPPQLRRDIARCQRQLRDLSNQRIRTA